MYDEFATDQISFYEGYVMKRAHKFPYKWSKKFVVIWSNGDIEISDGPRSKRRATKIFHCSDIQNINNSDINNPQNQYGFIIATVKRKWNLAVSSTDDRKFWISQFKEIIAYVSPSKNIQMHETSAQDKSMQKKSKSMIKKAMSISFRRKSTTNLIMDDNEISETEEEILDPRILALMDANQSAINHEMDIAKQKYNDLLQLYPSWNTLHLSYEFSCFSWIKLISHQPNCWKQIFSGSILQRY